MQACDDDAEGPLLALLIQNLTGLNLALCLPREENAHIPLP